MAVSEFSFGTNFIARSMTKGGVENLRNALTGGSMPPEVREEIAEKVQTAVAENQGVVPNELYREVAEMIFPYAPMKVSSIESALIASNFFGLTGKPRNVGTTGSSTGIEKYKKQVAEIERRTTATFSDQGTGGLVTDMAGVMVNAPRGAEIELTSPLQDIAPVAVYEIDGNDIEPGEDYVVSAEELEADMSSIRRDIAEIIVHYSETYQNANLSKDDIPDGDKYHYIILRDGSVQRGVHVSGAGQHCPGHDACSIGVCLVGGLSAASGEEDVVESVNAGSINRAQYNSLHKIFEAFFRIWPGGQALGHSEIDLDQNDPGFDVRDYVFSKFNKISLYEKPDEEAALTPDDIHERAIGVQGIPLLDKDPDVTEKYQ